MRSPSHQTALPTGIATLSGAELLAGLSDGREVRALEAFWRYGDPTLCAACVSALLDSGEAVLVDLVVGELVEPAITAPLPGAIIEGLRCHRPPLSETSARRLSKLARDGRADSQPEYDAAAPLIEAWLIDQAGTAGDALAVAALAGQTPHAQDETVRGAAFSRAAASSRVRKEAAKSILDGAEGDPGTAWIRGADLLERGCSGFTQPPDEVVRLLKMLVQLSPDHATSPFQPTLARFAAVGAVETVQGVLSSGPLAESVGAIAICGLVPGVQGVALRTKLFTLAVRAQPHLWPHLEGQLAAWTIADWKRALRDLARGSAVEQGPLLSMLSVAPPETMAALTAVALSPAAGPNRAPAISTAGSRLDQYLDELGSESNRDEWVAAVPWPRDADEDAIARSTALLGCLERSRHIGLAVRGLLADKVSATTAARLLTPEQTRDALELIPASTVRGRLALALSTTAPDELAAAVDQMQGETFGLDLMRALAPTHPVLGFAGAATAFPDLDNADKDELVESLSKFATNTEAALLTQIVEDDHKANANRRAIAADRLTELSPVGERPPACVTDLLKSNIPKLREAAIRAIETRNPHDEELIGQLHQVASAGTATSRAARIALDSLSEQFLAEVADAHTKAELHELLPLLGAVGRASALPVLFRYVGSAAEYDDAGLHRVAAGAILDAAKRISTATEEDQAILVRLLEGDDGEADPEAHANLSEALTHIQLGDDAALRILFEEIAITPKESPDGLFGDEKDSLVRHLGLFARAEKQGASGRGLAITQLDNVAERLVRAAYLAVGESEPIKEKIRTDPRAPDYGNLIGALASVKSLQSIRAECEVLHEIRCSRTEVPHPGEEPDEAAMVTARSCFKKIGKVSVGTLQQARRRSA